MSIKTITEAKLLEIAKKKAIAEGYTIINENENDAMTVAKLIKSKFEFVSRPSMVQGPEIDDYNKNMTVIRFRDWGRWEMPEGEEDDGDYDWEVLSDQSYKKANEIMSTFQKDNPNLKIEWNTGEKNWITIEISKK